MLSLEEAQFRILALIKPAVAEEVPLCLANQRFVLENVRAQADLPGFDNSAMDGYAVRAEDLKNARAEMPVLLRLTGRIAAGQSTGGMRLDRGTCVRVFTGSMLPDGADGVIMQEDTRPGRPETIECLDSIRPFENVRLKGEDVKRGDLLLEAGDRLNAAKLSVCAAAGIASVRCGSQPSVGIIATGSELMEPGLPLAEGQIYESNRLALASLTRQAGAVARVYPIVQDSLEETRTALRTAFKDCDFVVSSGGVSVGELDFVKLAFNASGGTLDFWRVAMKPGKPFVLGRLDEKLLFGLPGNPVSAFVTFLLLVRPALLRAQGAVETGLRIVSSHAAERFTNQSDRRHFVRVRFGEDGDVSSSGVQASHMLASLARAQGLVDLAPDSLIEQGAPLSVLVWE